MWEAHLQAAGVDVTFVGKLRVLQVLSRYGLCLSDPDGGSRRLDAPNLRLVTKIPVDIAPGLVPQASCNPAFQQ